MLPNFETASVGPQCSYAKSTSNGFSSLYNLDRSLWRAIKRAETSRDEVFAAIILEDLAQKRREEAANLKCPIYKQFVDLESAKYFAENGTKGE